MKDPLAKTPADKLIIARQEWLALKKKASACTADAEKARALVTKAEERMTMAQRVFDETYSGD